MFLWGQAGDIPIVGDWTNSGVKRIGIFRRGFWLLDVNNGHQWACGNPDVCDGWSGNDASFFFGRPGDIPVIGDWTHNGIERIGVFRNGYWFLDINNDHRWTCDKRGPCDGSNGNDLVFRYGQPGDIPLAGDWTNSGFTRIGVFRDGLWLLDVSGTHDISSALAINYGQAGDIPVVGDWTHTSTQRIGVFRGGAWILDVDHSFDSNASAQVWSFGRTGDIPVVHAPRDVDYAANAGWVASWGASVSNPSPSYDGGAIDSTLSSFFGSVDYRLPAQATVRQLAHLSIGANSGIRLRFSNALAAAPATFIAVHVALSAGSTSAVVPGSDQVVTFNGSASVTIPAGAEAFSDPIALRVAPGADIAISFYTGNDAPSVATVHALSQSTVFYTSGVDATGCMAFDSTCPGLQVQSVATSLVRPYLSGVEVVAPGSYAVVILGDSITDGVFTAIDANQRWPDYLSARLIATGSNVGVVNGGIATDCILFGCGYKPKAIDRFQRDVTSVAGVRYLIVFEGVNDIGLQTGTADELIAAYQDLVARAHSQNILVYGATITPFGNSVYDSPENEQMRQTLNEFIRMPGNFDAVIDFDMVLSCGTMSPCLPPYPAQIFPAWSSDWLHPNDAGYRAMANAIDLALLRR